MCVTTSPDVLVIGGGLARGAGSRLLDPIAGMVAQDITSRLGIEVSVRAAALGDDAGLVGGGAWFNDREKTR
jgi:predicted NBD/HSP70 family sugar kinase